MKNNDIANSYVTKSFLIDIITRDIGIKDAILELVDNSIDRAIELYKFDVTRNLIEDFNIEDLDKSIAPLFVKITFDKDSFIIEDNCGGISRSDLTSEVFLFGLQKNKSDYLGLSAFGVGMKRSFFKLGRLIEIRTKTQDEETCIYWDIDEWIELQQGVGIIEQQDNGMQKNQHDREDREIVVDLVNAVHVEHIGEER